MRCYYALIRSRLDYGAMLYDTATNTTLKKLDKIQNMCLRIALGVYKSTPIISLEAESNCLPLFIHRKFLLLSYIYRVSELPLSLPTCKAIFGDPMSLMNYRWSSHYKAPMMIRFQENQSDIIGITLSGCRSTTLLSPIPPWYNIDAIISSEFSGVSVKTITNRQANKLFEDMIFCKYAGYSQAYTDGSKSTKPVESSSSAFLICTGEGTVLKKFNCGKYISVLGTELYAIYKTLLFIKNNVNDNKTVLFTDSMSGLELLKNDRPNNYVGLVYDIQKLLLGFAMQNVSMKLQYIPGHKGILGNEIVDQAAKDALLLTAFSPVPISSRDKKLMLSSRIKKPGKNIGMN